MPRPKEHPCAVTKTLIRRDDTVVALAGRDRGRRGRVLRVHPDLGVVFVEGINVVTKASRPNAKLGLQGGLVKKEGPIKLSKVMVLCPTCQKPRRLGVRSTEDGKRQRFCRKCGNVVRGA